MELKFSSAKSRTSFFFFLSLFYKVYVCITSTEINPAVTSKRRMRHKKSGKWISPDSSSNRQTERRRIGGTWRVQSARYRVRIAGEEGGHTNLQKQRNCNSCWRGVNDNVSARAHTSRLEGWVQPNYRKEKGNKTLVGLMIIRACVSL